MWPVGSGQLLQALKQGRILSDVSWQPARMEGGLGGGRNRAGQGQVRRDCPSADWGLGGWRTEEGVGGGVEGWDLWVGS